MHTLTESPVHTLAIACQNDAFDFNVYARFCLVQGDERLAIYYQRLAHDAAEFARVYLLLVI